ncbi:response regulator [Microbacterium sp. BG28]|uniref:response regulator n=1 Tax=Microbacterium sp. BG28 TaxID=3097356 RepID=UPI002A5A227A|nr:response regulator [Microbacterium sp. BG28]MDY0830048.1 response regulator [Microbacterium sp. BG28]
MNGNIRVLVVDDDRGARALHSRFVAATSGFTVVGTAASGREALGFAGDAVDLILLDMRLPDISGIEVLHRLRTIGGSEVDVIVISSSQDQTTVRQALAAHVVGYLIKPFTESALRAQLEQYRNRRQQAQQDARERPLSQGEIDRLLATGGIRTGTHAAVAPAAALALPKGLAQPTLDRVAAALDPVVARSGADVATACDLSRTTAHRYLTHLVDLGLVDRAHRYGKRGRPEVLYRLAPAHAPDATTR